MTAQDSLKTEVRSRMGRTGEKYTVALETVKTYRHPNVAMMRGNGSLDGAVLRSYLPLAELLDSSWIIANTGPGWNQILYMPNPDWDTISIYGGTVAPHEVDELDGDEPSTEMDLIPFDDVMELDHSVPLNECFLFYVSEGLDVNGNQAHHLPGGEPPAGKRHIDELTGSLAVIILNDGPNFVKNIAEVLNWISSSATAANGN